MKVFSEEEEKDGELGYRKLYTLNEKTLRPNQLFQCKTCGAYRHKISKILKHINVHATGRKVRTRSKI